MAIEVELRAIIKDDTSLAALLEERRRATGRIVRQSRFLVDYSTFIEGIGERKRDIRARVTNGVREIIVKVGAFGGSARLESSVVVNSSTRDLLTTMAYMGFEEGVAAIRIIERFRVGDVEYAIQEVRPYHSPGEVFCRFVEAEIAVDRPELQDEAEHQVRKGLARLGLDVISAPDWYDFVAMLNAEANGVFDFKAPNWPLVESLGLDAG